MNLSIENNYVILIDDDGVPRLLFSVDVKDYACRKSPQEVVNGFTAIVSKYDDIAKYTYNEIPFVDAVTIVSSLIQKLIKCKATGVKVLEIGSGYGCAAILISLTLKLFSEDNVLFAFDTPDGTSDDPFAASDHVSQHFGAALKWAGVDGQVCRLSGSCLKTAVDSLRGNYFDIVFYNKYGNSQTIQSELKRLFRVMKTEGLILGQNCACKTSLLPQDTAGLHTELIGALHEVFGDCYELTNSVWSKIISEQDKHQENADSMQMIDLCKNISTLVLQIETQGITGSKDEVFAACKKLDQVLQLLNSGTVQLDDLELKTLSASLQNDIVFVYSAIETENVATYQKYFQLVLDRMPKWKKTVFDQFGN